MPKKRVHELAKELKAAGIELDNREIVTKLQGFGYDVKSHSSSLEDDQASAALERIIAELKPRPAPPPAKAAGFLVRRKSSEAAVPVAAPASVVEEVPADESAEAEAALEAEAPEEAPAAQEAPTPSGEQEQAPSAPAQQAAAPAPALAPARTHAPYGPRPQVSHVAHMGHGASTHAAASASPSVDPRTLRPTATQAVVISRPTVPVKRTTPPSDAHRRIPMAPGQRAIGEVKEFKVVSDLLGRGRELIDVTRDKAGKKKAKTNVKENLSKQEIMDIARGRAALPIRGKKKRPTKKGAKTQITEMSEEKKVISVETGITVSELSQRMGVKASDLLKKLMGTGTIATVNQTLDVDTVTALATGFGWKVEKAGFEVDEALKLESDAPESMKPRPPVVTIMGHVDHGKTSLLDAIRKANVAAGEAGGITQHIGAYSVQTSKGPVTFLDTPGHEAFTAMRARGAKATDLVVLVVAADDGVMPQTIEAINHAKAAEVPILVAINKVDKPGADIQRVKSALIGHGLQAEDMGGETVTVPVSAKTKQGLDDLLEMICLQAEVLELKANPDKRAQGVIIEAKLEKGRGPVATVIVHEGTLRTGDPMVTGMFAGKVRAMMNDRGEQVKEVLPGYPVEVIGLSGVPVAGDTFHVVEDEKTAIEIAEHRAAELRQANLAGSSKVSLEDLFKQIAKGEAKELRIVVKADVQGSVEAVSEALKKLSTPKVKVSILHSGVGGVSESDVMLAAASQAIIVGFNSRPEPKAGELARQEGVQLKQYSIIYEAVDEVKLAMEGLLEPIRREKVLGRAEVRSLFSVPKLGTIAGVAVTDGKISRSAMVRLIRDKVPLHAGRVSSLKRFKDDVREVASGFECGVAIENYSDIRQGDILEAFEIEEIRQSLS